MDITGKHIAILVDNYFEQAEFEEPLSTLKDAGGEVTVIAAHNVALQGMNHAERGDTFTADITLEQASSGDYDALVLPGGTVNVDNLRVNVDAQRFALDFLDSDRPLAAICHAPWLLVSADAVEGRRLTSFPTIKDDITNAGGEWVNLPVVIDNNLITSREPNDIPQFTDALISALQKKPGSVIQGGPDTIVDTSEVTNEATERMRLEGYDEERDELEDVDEADILTDEDLTDPDELHLSDVEPDQEQEDIA